MATEKEQQVEMLNQFAARVDALRAEVEGFEAPDAAEEALSDVIDHLNNAKSSLETAVTDIESEPEGESEAESA